jgi:hypothetical protein
MPDAHLIAWLESTECILTAIEAFHGLLEMCQGTFFTKVMFAFSLYRVDKRFSAKCYTKYTYKLVIPADSAGEGNVINFSIDFIVLIR